MASHEPKLTEYGAGATRDDDTFKINPCRALSPYFIEALAEYISRNRRCVDGTVRTDDNWKLGIPLARFEESLGRHHLEFWKAVECGDREGARELLLAQSFNIQGWIHEDTKWQMKSKQPPSLVMCEPGQSPQDMLKQWEKPQRR